MRIVTSIVLTAAMIGMVVHGAAVAQEVRNGGPKGTVQSAVATVAPSSFVSMLYLSENKPFILNQVCITGSPSVVVTNFGTIITNPGDGCTSFSPGIALPVGEVINCDDSIGGSGGSCLVSGVLSKKKIKN